MFLVEISFFDIVNFIEGLCFVKIFEWKLISRDAAATVTPHLSN